MSGHPGASSDWASAEREFIAADGSLLAVFARDAGADAWSRFLGGLPRSHWDAHCDQNGDRVALPAAFSAALNEGNATVLTVDPDGLNLHCHFFEPDVVELDLEPSSVTNAPAYQRLIGFMTWLADTIGKPVALAHEGWRRGSPVIATVEPSDRSV
jgi:hypothetical protein